MFADLRTKPGFGGHRQYEPSNNGKTRIILSSVNYLVRVTEIQIKKESQISKLGSD